jgi:hypothetical protein
MLSLIVQMASARGHFEVAPAAREQFDPSTTRRIRQTPRTTLSWYRHDEGSLLVGCDADCAILPGSESAVLEALSRGGSLTVAEVERETLMALAEIGAVSADRT